MKNWYLASLILLGNRAGGHAHHCELIGNVIDDYRTGADRNSPANTDAMGHCASDSDPAQTSDAYITGEVGSRANVNPLLQTTIMIDPAACIRDASRTQFRTNVHNSSRNHEGARSQFCVRTYLRMRMNNAREVQPVLTQPG
jgi:hypothetical protein